MVPTDQERLAKERVFQSVQTCVLKAFDEKDVEVQAFGSFVNGLSLWDSDIDVVTTGVMFPDKLTGGFDRTDRRAVANQLDKIVQQLRKNKKIGISKIQVIRSARIPIIKLTTKSKVVVDISLGDKSGPRAANYVIEQIRGYPPLKPLVLVLKVYLKSCGLNEVATGGLSSYSLTNMVLAHLMEELKDGRDIYDLGEALYGFLVRYGEEFDYESDAVAVQMGGIIPKLALQRDRAYNPGTNAPMYMEGYPLHDRIMIEDPLTGRDIASGSFRMDLIRQAFYRGARRLEALVKGRKSSLDSINYLSALFDLGLAVRRVRGKDKQYYDYLGSRPRRPPATPVAETEEEEDEVLWMDMEDDAEGSDDEMAYNPGSVVRRR